MTARRPVDAPPPVHSDAAHRAITDELVRCTLTGAHRRELALSRAALWARTLVDPIRAAVDVLAGRSVRQ